MVDENKENVSKEVCASEKYIPLHKMYILSILTFFISLLTIVDGARYFAIGILAVCSAYFFLKANQEMEYLEKKYGVPSKRFNRNSLRGVQIK